MKVTCGVCDTVFTFEITNEIFGTSRDNDFNMYKLNCPDCGKLIIIRTQVDYSPLVSKETK